MTGRPCQTSAVFMKDAETCLLCQPAAADEEYELETEYELRTHPKGSYRHYFLALFISNHIKSHYHETL